MCSQQDKPDSDSEQGSLMIDDEVQSFCSSSKITQTGYLGPLGSELDSFSWQRIRVEAFLTPNLHVPLNWTQTEQTKGRTCQLYGHPTRCCYPFPASFFAATLRELFAEVLRRQAGKQAHQQWGRGAVSLMSSKAVNTRIARRRCICSHVYPAE